MRAESPARSRSTFGIAAGGSLDAGAAVPPAEPPPVALRASARLSRRRSTLSFGTDARRAGRDDDRVSVSNRFRRIAPRAWRTGSATGGRRRVRRCLKRHEPDAVSAMRSVTEARHRRPRLAHDYPPQRVTRRGMAMRRTRFLLAGAGSPTLTGSARRPRYARQPERVCRLRDAARSTPASDDLEALCLRGGAAQDVAAGWWRRPYPRGARSRRALIVAPAHRDSASQGHTTAVFIPTSATESQSRNHAPRSLARTLRPRPARGDDLDAMKCLRPVVISNSTRGDPRSRQRHGCGETGADGTSR